VFAAGFVYAPQGRLWNARLLPFYYLLLYLLAAVGIAELGRLLSALFARDVNRPIRTLAAVTPILGWGIAATMLAMSLQVMPGGHLDTEGVYRWGPGGIISTKDRSFVDSWAKWNFQGYEGWERPVLKDAQGYPKLDENGNVAEGPPTYAKSYPEYFALMTTMKNLGAEQGCGRAMWEHEEQHDRYGTPMALMLLPFWTDGCIGSMEGLYFEASTTTPYHFINQDELSWGPSNAQRDLPYGPGATTKPEFDLGIKHLQMDGVKYYMAINDNTKAFANSNPSLSAIKTSGPWTIYSVADSPLVEALRYEPAILTGQPTTGRPWQDTSVCWYMNEASWDVFLAADGPDNWQKVERTVIPDEKALPSEKCAPTTNWGWFSNDGGPELKAQKAITVTPPIVSDDSITFDVSEPGVPVRVKASYFPNWKVSGADGPYRVTPNFMVVVPTSNHVELHYGYTSLDLISYLVTLLGLVGLFFLVRAKPVSIKPAWSFWGRAERPDLYPTIGPDLRFEHDAFEYESAAVLAAIVPDFTDYGYGYGVPPDDHPPEPARPDVPEANETPASHEAFQPPNEPMQAPADNEPVQAPTDAADPAPPRTDGVDPADDLG
jgi:hypothetical protein